MSEPDLLTARTAYDAVAAFYADQFKDTLDNRPVERGLLAAFAEKVRHAPAGPVTDLGCGPGHIAAHLHGLGLPVLGVDQSAEMLAVGRARYPGVRFALSSITKLGLADDSCSGALSRSSVIHLPPALFVFGIDRVRPGARARRLAPAQLLSHRRPRTTVRVLRPPGRRRLPLVAGSRRFALADSGGHRDRPASGEPRTG
jgi:SAM-dependent methyltransferase